MYVVCFWNNLTPNYTLESRQQNLIIYWNFSNMKIRTDKKNWKEWTENLI